MNLTQILLSNVSLGTANILAYIMLVIVAVFLISSTIIVYIYYRNNKRLKAVSPVVSA